MTCEDVRSLLIDYIDYELEDDYKYGFESHIESCEDCAKELQELQFLFGQMADEKLIMPGEGLRIKFNAMLQSELNLQATQNIVEKETKTKIFSGHWTSPIWKVAAACIIFSAGILTGVSIKQRPANIVPRELSDMKIVPQDIKEPPMLNLLKDESASQRIKAVSYTEDMPNPNEKIVHALINTLNEDKNVNVRLAALYSLNKFPDHGELRDSLIQSLTKQTEPIIQIVLINILLKRNETRAIQPIKEIISKTNTIQEVKEIGKKALKEL